MDTCMYMGGDKLQPDGSLKGFMDYTPEEIMNQIYLQRKAGHNFIKR